MIIGCDVHSRYQVIAMLEPGTGEVVDRRLGHENGEAKAFYAGLPKASLIGIEATGYTQWFERMVEELGHKLWVGEPEAARLMQQKGVGLVTALAFVLTLGPVERFANSRKVVSYLGLNPSEHSSGGRQRLGHTSKRGNEMPRWLRVEAGQSAAQFDPELRRKYQRLKFRRGAKAAIARHLAARLYWMPRQRKVAPSPVRTPESPARTLVDASSLIL